MIKKISIFGWFGERNTGDDFLLQETLNCIQSKFNNAEITVYSNHIEELARKNKNRSICYLPKKPKYIITGLFKNKYFIYGPGGLFPNKNLKKIIAFSVFVALLKLMRKKIIFFGLGVENCNFSNPINRFLIYSIFRMSTSCTLRYDYHMYETQKRMPKKCIPAVDLMFSKDLNKKHTIDSRYVVVSLANIFKENSFSQQFQQEIVVLIRKIIDDGYTIKFLTFTDGKDNKLNERIYNLLEKEYQAKCEIIEYLEDLEEVLGIISGAKYVIAMRYHALVFAIAHNVPFVSVSYSSKHDELLYEVGMSEYSVRVCEGVNKYYCERIPVSAEELLNKVSMVADNRDSIIRSLKIKRDILKKKSNNNKVNLITSLSK